ncbi:TPA: phage repressor protein CI [Escherichia coli]|nr:phage repressor protein CI [Escherichia coli]
MSTQKFTFRHMDDDMKAVVIQNRGGQKVIERILMAYGFKSRQAFCNHLGISQSTMANRYARDTFPADWIVICSLETGASIKWLAFGSDDDEQMPSSSPEQHVETHSEDGSYHDVHYKQPKFDNENIIDYSRGGKEAIERIVRAYGYKTRQALADHLGISKSTLATRYMRDVFPSDWIIKCALETGTSLMWLTTGKGPKFDDARNDVIAITHKKITDGNLFDSNFYMLDKALLPDSIQLPLIVSTEKKTYLCNQSFDEITDGKWIVKIEGKVSIRTLTRIPVGRLKISDNDLSFECKISDIDVIAKCKFILIEEL